MSVLRLRDVRLIVSAVGISAVGDAALWILLALHVGATGTPLAVSALFLCLWGPVVALGGVAGRLVDRHENRRLLILVSLGQAVVVAAMALSLGSLPVLLALCALLGAGVAISSPAEFALVPAAAGEEHVAAANGQVEAARGLGATAGPLLGGLLAAAGWTEAGLLLNAASFAAVALAAFALHARRAPSGDHAHAREHGGRAVLFGDRTLAITLGASIVALLFFTISVAAEVFFVSDVLQAGPAVYGLLMTGWTLGMVGGAVGLARRVPRTALATAALACVAAQGAGLLGAALGATILLSLAGFLAGGARPRGEERPAPHADPRARAGAEPRARVRHLQRAAQRRRAGGAVRGRRPRRARRRADGARRLGRHPPHHRARRAGRARAPRARHDPEDRICPASRLTASPPWRSTTCRRSTTA